MFSLIVTIISIALVAALALATLYYGGGAFNKGSAKADAAKILLQGQQLIGASELFQAGENRWPDNMPELQNSKYITSVPVAKAAVQAAIELASAAGTEWTMPKDKAPMFLLRNVASLDVCGYVNLQGSLKSKGVLAKAYTGLTIQCYGPEAGLQVIIKKSTEVDSLESDPPGVDLPGIDPDLVAIVLPPSVVGCVADPASCPGRAVDDPTVWTDPPAVPAPAGGGTGPSQPPAPPLVIYWDPSNNEVTTFIFPDTQVGETSAPVEFYVESQSRAALELSGATVNAPFNLISSNCSGTFGYWDGCLVTVTFSPTAKGLVQSQLALVSPTAGLDVLQLSGTGLVDGPVTRGRLIASTSIFKFPDTAPGGWAWATPMPVLTNTGPGDVQLTSITPSNTTRFWPWISTEPGSFPTWYEGDTAGPGLCKAVLAAGSSCQLYAEFYPGAGLNTSTAVLVTSEGNFDFTMKGKGVVLPRLSGSSINFGAVNSGQTVLFDSARGGPLMVSNVSDDPFLITAVTSSAPGTFSAGMGTCTSALPPYFAQGCFPSIAFTPPSTGLFTGIVTISTTVGDVSVSVAGQGLGAPQPLRTLTLHRGLNSGVAWGDRIYPYYDFDPAKLMDMPGFLTDTLPQPSIWTGLYPAQGFAHGVSLNTSGMCRYIEDYDDSLNLWVTQGDDRETHSAKQMALNDTCFVRPTVPLGTNYLLELQSGSMLYYVKVAVVRGPNEPSDAPLYQGGKVSYMNPVGPADAFAYPGEYALNCPGNDAAVKNVCQASRIRDEVLAAGNTTVQCNVVNSAGPAPYFESYEIVCTP